MSRNKNKLTGINLFQMLKIKGRKKLGNINVAKFKYNTSIIGSVLMLLWWDKLSIQIIVEHSYGYKDKSLTIDKLSLAARLNTEKNCRAKELTTTLIPHCPNIHYMQWPRTLSLFLSTMSLLEWKAYSTSSTEQHLVRENYSLQNNRVLDFTQQ